MNIQTNRQINKQIDKTNRQIDKQIDRQIERQIIRQIGRKGITKYNLICTFLYINRYIVRVVLLQSRTANRLVYIDRQSDAFMVHKCVRKSSIGSTLKFQPIRIERYNSIIQSEDAQRSHKIGQVVRAYPHSISLVLFLILMIC